jgi:Calx-beta domain-containing protein
LGAFRVALGVVFVLLLASPASAQFKTEDLNGPWLLHATRVGVRQAGEAGWLQGSLFFLRSGSLSADEVRDQDGTAVPLGPGALSVSSSGVVTGALDDGNIAVRGQFAEWNRIVGTATADAGAPDETNTFFVLIRQPTGAFTQADAIGTWRLNTLLVPDPRTTTPEWVSGQIVIDDSGAITNGSLSSSNGSTATSASGTLFVEPDGGFSGRLDIGPFGDDHTIFSGTFVRGRELMVGAASRALPGEGQHGMFVLQREPTVLFAPADAGGTWELFSVEALIDGNPVGAWLRGTLTADSLGVVTGGTLTDGFGNSFTVQGGLIAVVGDGLVFAEILFDSGLDVLALQGSMLSNKAQIFGVDTFGGQTVFPRLGFSTLVKPTAAGPTPAIVQFSRPDYTVTEGTASAVITALSTGTSTTPFTVPYTATPVTAVPGQDFTPVSGTLSFAAGALSRTFSVPIVNNTLIDGNRSVLLALGPPVGNAVLGQQATAALAILDNDQGGVIKLSAAAYTVAETTASVVVTILRTGTSLAGNVSVAYTTGNGSALSGLDYTATTGIITFNPGQTSRTVSIPILNDTVAEGNETFTFTLSDPSSGAVLGSPASAVVTIKSEDAGGLVKFSAAAYSFTEGAGNVSVTVVRSGGTASDVTVDYTATGGTASAGADFAVLSGTLTFAAKQTTATIPVAILQDQLAEGNETFTLTLGNPQGGAALAAPFVATVTIVDDEPAIQLSAGDYVGKEGLASVITLLRSGPLTAPATVTFTANPGTATPGLDFTPVSTLVTFAANQASKTVSVPVLNNTLVQGNRTVLLGLSAPTGAELGTRATAVLTIPEDDQGGLIKLSAAAYTVAETTASVLVTILRTGTNLAGNVSVAYTTGNGSASAGLDYTATTGVVTFNPGQTSQTVRIPILNDTLVEPDEIFPFTLFNPTGGASLGTPASALVTIKSEDASGLVKFSAAAYSFTEGAGNVSVTVVRTGGTASDVTVAYTTADGTATAGADYVTTAGTLTFAGGQTSATIVVPILQDSLAEGKETFTLTLGSPQGGAVLAAPSVTTVTIVDDESVVEFSLRFVGNMPEVVRTGSLAAQATVDFVSEDGTATGGIDYLPLSGTLTFRPGVASQYIPLAILPDILAEGPETFTLTLVNPQPQGVLGLGERSSQTLTIADNDFGGVVQFGTAATTAAPGESRDIPIVRTGGGAPVIVNWQAVSGASSEAFSPTSGSVTFAANETSRSFTINVADMESSGSDVTAVFALSVAPGAATVGTPNSSTLTIVGSRAEVN